MVDAYRGESLCAELSAYSRKKTNIYIGVTLQQVNIKNKGYLFIDEQGEIRLLLSILLL